MEKPPLVVSIYETATLKLMARFNPGYGGELAWTSAGTLFHRWGAGTNCCCYAVYNREGKVLLEDSTSGTELSPGRRFLLTGPTFEHGEAETRILDLQELKIVYRGRHGHRSSALEHLWTSRNQAVILEEQEDGSTRTIELELRVRT